MDKSKKNEEKKNNETEGKEIIRETKGTEEKEEIQENNDTKVQALEQQVKELDNKWKRALADYQNQEKRTQEERIEWIKSANRDLLLRILPILDTLISAKQHSEDQALTVSISQFLGILKDENITRIETVGKEFNPNCMEAITTEEGKENEVLKELRAGYMLNDKILRVAQVTVGNGKS
jgi:molecular chaperone GrpE